MTDRSRQYYLRFLQWLVSGQILSLTPLYRLRNFLYRKCLGVGARCIILEHVSIRQLHYLKGTFSAGEDVIIQRGCVLDYSGGLEIGSGVAISEGCYILSHMHQIGPEARRIGKAEPRKTVIENGAWLGAHVTVLGGVRIGAGAVIGAGSVVTKNVEPNQIWAGNPAKFIRSIPKEVEQ